jgi:hypothetical protein
VAVRYPKGIKSFSLGSRGTSHLGPLRAIHSSEGVVSVLI